MSAAYSCPRCGEPTQLYSSEDGYWPIIARFDSRTWLLEPLDH